MWYCTACGTENEDSSLFCVECGQARPVPPAQNRAQASANAAYEGAFSPVPPRRRSLWWVWLLAALAVLSAAAVICFFTIHKWTPATCTEPETCSICGRERGEPLGHDAAHATCTDSSVCARCGETVAPALGHYWQSATYDTPETCIRCGLQRGDLKGWVGSLHGHMGDENLNLSGDGESHPYLLDRPVRNCLRMTLFLQLTEVEGNPYGNWGLFGRDLQGNWQLLDIFYVARTAYNNFVAFPIAPGGYPSFDALSMVPMTDEDYSISYSFYYEDVQEYID